MVMLGWLAWYLKSQITSAVSDVTSSYRVSVDEVLNLMSNLGFEGLVRGDIHFLSLFCHSSISLEFCKEGGISISVGKEDSLSLHLVVEIELFIPFGKFK